MTVALVGGLDRLAQQYKSAAEEHGIDLRVFSKRTCDFSCKLAGVDAIILFTNLVSHDSAKQVYKLARSKSVCLICSHNSSLSAARRCLFHAKRKSPKMPIKQAKTNHRIERRRKCRC